MDVLTDFADELDADYWRVVEVDPAEVAVGRDDHVAVLCDIPADVAAPGFLGTMVDQVWWLCDRLGPLLDAVIATGEVPAAEVIEASLKPDNVPADRH